MNQAEFLPSVHEIFISQLHQPGCWAMIKLFGTKLVSAWISGLKERIGNCEDSVGFVHQVND